MINLKSELESRYESLRDEHIWYDKDQSPSEQDMKRGVRRSKYFVLYLTEGDHFSYMRYFTGGKHFCLTRFVLQVS